MDNKFQKFIDFLVTVHQVTDEITKENKPAYLTPAQFNILQYISVRQPVTVSQISDCLKLSMPNTSRELKKLSEKNLCEKFTVTEDRRKQYIRLSKDGEVMKDEFFKRIEEGFYHRIKAASNEDLKEIEHALDILQAKVFYTQQ